MIRTGSAPRVLVFEYVTGGGWPPGDLPVELATEGRAMLEAVLADFHTWGVLQTVTTCDRRLVDRAPFANEVVEVEPGQWVKVLAELLPTCKAALMIAPETDGILAHLSALVKAAGVVLLGSDPQAVATAGDKWTCYQRLRAAGLPVPETLRVPATEIRTTACGFGLPLVIKPVDGVGCEGVCLVQHFGELDDALAVLTQTTRGGEALIQRFVDGEHVSVSLLVANGQALPLSLNGQLITPGRPFRYHGGVVPLVHPAASRALSVAQAAVKLLPGLRGYVGVDLVIAGREAWLMEINPRLTTSYIGLRRVVSLNLAQAIWQACWQGVLPKAVDIQGQVTFIVKSGQISVVSCQ